MRPRFFGLNENHSFTSYGSQNIAGAGLARSVQTLQSAAEFICLDIEPQLPTLVKTQLWNTRSGKNEDREFIMVL